MLRIDQLSIRYGPRFAVRDVTLQVARGSITAIVGPSGCGKSSLLQAVNRMTDEIPSAVVDGTVRIAGRDSRTDYPYVPELRRAVGLVFQKPNPFPTSIQRNIELALREHGVREKEARRKICERVLRDTGLWDEVKDRLEQPAQSLSGGQQQRLCIARAIAIQPQVLLMDEPCSALDPDAARHVERLILSLKESYTILIVTHNLAQARRISDHLALFWQQDGCGRLVEFGPTQELFQQPQHAVTKAYLSGWDG